MRHGLLLLLLLARPVLAQADLPDAGLPSVVVGGTGAERASEEEEDGTSNPCLSDHDCDRGFACVAAKCTWRRYRDATEEGCGAESVTGLWMVGALLLLRRRFPRAHFLGRSALAHLPLRSSCARSAFR